MLTELIYVGLTLLIVSALVISCAALSGGPRPRGPMR